LRGISAFIRSHSTLIEQSLSRWQSTRLGQPRAAKARAALSLKQITQKPPLKTLQKIYNQEAI
jgi:hypothetical protein